MFGVSQNAVKNLSAMKLTGDDWIVGVEPIRKKVDEL